MSTTDSKIVACFIVPASLAERRYQAEVHVTYADRVSEIVFSYYDDELHFRPDEFLGLTRQQAIKLFHDRDIAYLQS